MHIYVYKKHICIYILYIEILIDRFYSLEPSESSVLKLAARQLELGF